MVVGLRLWFDGLKLWIFIVFCSINPREKLFQNVVICCFWLILHKTCFFLGYLFFIVFREKHLFRSPGGKVFNSRKLAVQYLEENGILPTEELEKFRNGPKKRKRGKIPGRRKVCNVFLFVQFIFVDILVFFTFFSLPPPQFYKKNTFLNFVTLNAYF